ncbi:hypothetical protein [Lactococcus taiwanensis]|uniref:hypothetical protein n=1 Tax=Lactococcus taiwanensis TaxID=1151742 RepID=UPI001F06DB50|nr:hypothetical protein [Lactococcus taiwanensis]
MMSKEERLLKFKNELNFGIETKEGTFYVPKDDVIKIVSDLLDEVSQPQLTIPESVAVELDSVFAGIDATDIGYVLDQTGPYGSRAFNDYYFKNKNIIAVYLAGKALGVDLVKVVEK